MAVILIVSFYVMFFFFKYTFQKYRFRSNDNIKNKLESCCKVIEANRHESADVFREDIRIIDTIKLPNTQLRKYASESNLRIDKSTEKGESRFLPEIYKIDKHIDAVADDRKSQNAEHDSTLIDSQTDSPPATDRIIKIVHYTKDDNKFNDRTIIHTIEDTPAIKNMSEKDSSIDSDAPSSYSLIKIAETADETKPTTATIVQDRCTLSSKTASSTVNCSQSSAGTFTFSFTFTGEMKIDSLSDIKNISNELHQVKLKDVKTLTAGSPKPNMLFLQTGENTKKNTSAINADQSHSLKTKSSDNTEPKSAMNQTTTTMADIGSSEISDSPSIIQTHTALAGKYFAENLATAVTTALASSMADNSASNEVGITETNDKSSPDDQLSNDETKSKLFVPLNPYFLSDDDPGKKKLPIFGMRIDKSGVPETAESLREPTAPIFYQDSSTSKSFLPKSDTAFKDDSSNASTTPNIIPKSFSFNADKQMDPVFSKTKTTAGNTKSKLRSTLQNSFEAHTKGWLKPVSRFSNKTCNSAKNNTILDAFSFGSPVANSSEGNKTTPIASFGSCADDSFWKEKKTGITETLSSKPSDPSLGKTQPASSIFGSPVANSSEGKKTTPISSFGSCADNSFWKGKKTGIPETVSSKPADPSLGKIQPASSIFGSPVANSSEGKKTTPISSFGSCANNNFWEEKKMGIPETVSSKPSDPSLGKIQPASSIFDSFKTTPVGFDDNKSIQKLNGFGSAVSGITSSGFSSFGQQLSGTMKPAAEKVMQKNRNMSVSLGIPTGRTRTNSFWK